MRQRVGVQEQHLLLQRDHHRLLSGVPVREPLRQAQCARRPRGRILGLPVVYYCGGGVRAARVWDHRRQADADEGDRRVPGPRRQQDLL